MVNPVRAALSSPETTPAGTNDERRKWPTRDEFRRMTPAEVNQFFASVGSTWRVVDPATPVGVLDEAALREALERVRMPHRQGDLHNYGWNDAVTACLRAFDAAALGRSGSGGGRG